MTVGKPFGVLLRFSMPMLISVLFQQLYNIADTVIAGKFIGESALSAVGASYPITTILLAFGTGMNVGSSVVISKLFGAKRMTRMKTAINTALIACCVLSAVLTVAGFALSSPLLRLLGTPKADGIFAQAETYLNIYVGGLVFLFFYNIANGVFTALGNSRTPLIFLIFSSVGNILLDCVFVIVFNWGVEGVAWATFITQAVAATLSMTTLLLQLRKIATDKKPGLFSGDILAQITAVSIPSALQQSSISIGNMCVQRLINGFGSSAIAAFSAGSKIKNLGVTTVNALGGSLSPYVSQNLGAEKPERVRQGVRTMLKIGAAVSIPLTLFIFFAAEPLIGLFMKENNPEAVTIGVTYLRIVIPFLILCAIKNAFDGVLRGAGAMGCFMFATMADLGLRVVIAWILSGLLNSPTGIWLSWPIGWITSTVLTLIFYLKGVWIDKRETEETK